MHPGARPGLRSPSPPRIAVSLRGRRPPPPEPGGDARTGKVGAPADSVPRPSSSPMPAAQPRRGRLGCAGAAPLRGAASPRPGGGWEPHGPFKAGSGHVGQGSRPPGLRRRRGRERRAGPGTRDPRRDTPGRPLPAVVRTLTVARRERPRPHPHSDPAAAAAASPARVNRHLRP